MSEFFGFLFVIYMSIAVLVTMLDGPIKGLIWPVTFYVIIRNSVYDELSK